MLEPILLQHCRYSCVLSIPSAADQRQLFPLRHGRLTKIGNRRLVMLDWQALGVLPLMTSGGCKNVFLLALFVGRCDSRSIRRPGSRNRSSVVKRAKYRVSE